MEPEYEILHQCRDNLDKEGHQIIAMRLADAERSENIKKMNYGVEIDIKTRDSRVGFVVL